MVDLISAPDPHQLLPPVLACLPTAFASDRPPPALLDLVSPILRQRLQLITSTYTSSSESWLRLLCWDQEKGKALKDVVEGGTYEPHPSSGEIEIGEVGSTKYKRLDQDTLRAQIVLPEWNLIAVYLWCAGSEGGGGWKLAELLPWDSDLELDPSWSHSIAEANDSSRDHTVSEAIRDPDAGEQTPVGEDDDDDYWAQYDKTPGRTPAQNSSPTPNGSAAGRRISHSDREYYAQYSKVQPVMDSHDLSEVPNQIGSSSVQGDILESIMRRQSGKKEGPGPMQRETQGMQTGVAENMLVNHPQPSPPSSATLSAVARLEEGACQQSASEIGIRQHISTTMKSLYRLASSAGIERDEFDRIIHRELETNSILDT
ncbi:hypothetical protein EPUS_05617 [Endocarpon pusillum Z07020]|uniref:Uncharacterized protein n=1 Tax=Endocarpon pusillum (strain Z07020 / HMAS-L-300199) TaxID=1263415 RepID=U1G913_ENDPU|nr:uncharacterized protein EPUS_05617 [Endocarpon pusillum Z07020]ERF68478.1 hypothetical protein EPUS_05617 [Endocarpon pusillum Z07020]